MKTIFKLGTSTLLVFALATSARAQIGSVDLELPSSPIGDSVTVTPVGGSGEATNAGPYTYDLSNPGNLTVANDLGLAYSGNSYIATMVPKAGFCIALTTDIYENVQYTNFQLESVTPSSSGPLTATQLNNIIQLMDAYNAAGGTLTSPQYNTWQSDALSIAIWDVLNGKGTDAAGVSPSGYKINSGTGNDIAVSWTSDSNSSDTTGYAVYQANQWLASLTSASASLPSGDFLFALDGTNADNNEGLPKPVQNQSIVLALGSSMTDSSVGTPEPKDLKSLAGLALAALAAASVVGLRRRNNLALPLSS